jgi:excisionase family DNA binding protein
MRKLLNIDQVAQLFGVSKRTIERWVRDGKLPKPTRRFGFRKWNSEQLEPLRKSGRDSEQSDKQSRN